MATVTITLSKAHLEFVEEQASAGGFRSVSAYIDSLVRAERKRKAEEKLLALVREAEESGPSTPMTPEDWEVIRREVADRVAEGRKKRPRSGATPNSEKKFPVTRTPPTRFDSSVSVRL